MYPFHVTRPNILPHRDKDYLARSTRRLPCTSTASALLRLIPRYMSCRRSSHVHNVYATIASGIGGAVVLGDCAGGRGLLQGPGAGQVLVGEGYQARVPDAQQEIPPGQEPVSCGPP